MKKQQPGPVAQRAMLIQSIVIAGMIIACPLSAKWEWLWFGVMAVSLAFWVAYGLAGAERK